MYAGWVRVLSVLLLGVLAFLALALFSPLHQHESNGHCTLNDFEQVVVSHAEFSAPALDLSLLAWREPIVHERSATRVFASNLFTRGPPSLL